MTQPCQPRRRYALVLQRDGGDVVNGRALVLAVGSRRAVTGPRRVWLGFSHVPVPKGVKVYGVPKGAWARPGHDADIRGWVPVGMES